MTLQAPVTLAGGAAQVKLPHKRPMVPQVMAKLVLCVVNMIVLSRLKRIFRKFRSP
jgi:hypothetical protein